MMTQAQELAERFEQANNDVIAAAERYSDEQWRAHCADEERSVGVMAHHIASSHPMLIGMMQTIASGQQLPPITGDMIHQANAAHALEHAGCSKDETLELLRRNGAEAANAIRSLSDDQLQIQVTVPFLGAQPVTLRQYIEGLVIGHIAMHLAPMETTAAGVAEL
jgi:uncharacterized damage-inducible protein DinB